MVPLDAQITRTSALVIDCNTADMTQAREVAGHD
jgi:hypothetical protein